MAIINSVRQQPLPSADPERRRLPIPQQPLPPGALEDLRLLDPDDIAADLLEKLGLDQTAAARLAPDRKSVV